MVDEKINVFDRLSRSDRLKVAVAVSLMIAVGVVWAVVEVLTGRPVAALFAIGYVAASVVVPLARYRRKGRRRSSSSASAPSAQ